MEEDNSLLGDFQIKLEGKMASPSNFTLNETYYLLRDFQDAIKIELGSDFDEKMADINLSLVSLEKKCVLYTIGYDNESTIKTVEKIFNSIQTSNFTELAYRTVKKLNDFKNRIVKKEVYSEFLLDGKKVAEITNKTDISLQDIEIRDTTTIYAEIEKVGGASPAVRLRLPNGEGLTVNTSRDVAKRVSSKLYTFVGLTGIATWNKNDYSLLDFKIMDLIHVEEKPYNDTLNELRELLLPEINKFDNLNDFLLRD